jgi:adenylate cyclase
LAGWADPGLVPGEAQQPSNQYRLGSATTTRVEFEYPIPVVDARQLLKPCDGHVIEKIRHGIDYKGFTWEVDEFLGENAGLIVAEIELDAETQVFERPAWVAQEVTDDPRFFNSNLVMNPYCAWPHQPAG